MLVIGTRPEAIKLAPVAAALDALGLELAPRLLLTGQHLLEPAAFGLGRFEAARLACPGESDPHLHVARVTRAALPHVASADLVVVQGDTSSALGGALAAAEAGVAVAHVEAGLRTHDPRAPWPEEEFRVAIDSLAELLFAPTELSAANLRRERVPGLVAVTGNTAVDAVLAVTLSPRIMAARQRPRILVTCHRRESWGAGLRSIAEALHKVAAESLADIHFVLHPNPHVAFEMRRLLGGVEGIVLRPPCTHGEMLAAMRDADLVLSDSGGMQEEAPVFGVPLLVLRERTERPEGIACGSVELVGTDAARIVSAVERLLGELEALAAMRRAASPYGDGRASERIADAIVRWLGRRGIDVGSKRTAPHPEVERRLVVQNGPIRIRS